MARGMLVLALLSKRVGKVADPRRQLVSLGPSVDDGKGKVTVARVG